MEMASLDNHNNKNVACRNNWKYVPKYLRKEQAFYYYLSSSQEYK